MESHGAFKIAEQGGALTMENLRQRSLDIALQ